MSSKSHFHIHQFLRKLSTRPSKTNPKNVKRNIFWKIKKKKTFSYMFVQHPSNQFPEIVYPKISKKKKQTCMKLSWTQNIFFWVPYIQGCDDTGTLLFLLFKILTLALIFLKGKFLFHRVKMFTFYDLFNFFFYS